MPITPVRLLTLIPDLLILAGLSAALAVVVSQRARLGSRASMLGAVGLGILALNTLIIMVWSTFGVQLLLEEFRMYQIATVFAVVGIFSKLLWAAGIGLVLGALLTKQPAQVSS